MYIYYRHVIIPISRHRRITCQFITNIIFQIYTLVCKYIQSGHFFFFLFHDPAIFTHGFTLVLVFLFFNATPRTEYYQLSVGISTCRYYTRIRPIDRRDHGAKSVKIDNKTNFELGNVYSKKKTPDYFTKLRRL